jgi:hypothetical protein
VENIIFIPFFFYMPGQDTKTASAPLDIFHLQYTIPPCHFKHRLFATKIIFPLYLEKAKLASLARMNTNIE